jgi:hypothetical protein
MRFYKLTFLLSHSALFFGILSFHHIHNIAVAKQLYVCDIPPNLLRFLRAEATCLLPALSQQTTVNVS